MNFQKSKIITCITVLLLAAITGTLTAGEKTLTVVLRSRVPSTLEEGAYEIVSAAEEWAPARTAMIICDMWDAHWCKGATDRVKEIAPRLNEVVVNVRNRGVFIIHAPSSCMEFYQDHPARKRAVQARAANNIPENIGNWRSWMNEAEKADYPVDQTDGGCDCPVKCKQSQPWRRQIAAIEISEADAVSDSGTEIWNLLEERGVRNVILAGVHTNMCILGRPFGLRQMALNGKNVVLVRDLTDTMYNHESRPFVNHFAGTSCIIEHIEKHVCPTITSRAFDGKPEFRFKNDRRRRIVFIAAENEYRSAQTMAELARLLENRQGLACEFALGPARESGPKRHNILDMELLQEADMAAVFVRRRALPKRQLDCLKKYLKAGKPLLAIRTASHAFDAKGKAPASLVEWIDFDKEVLGCDYQGHYGHDAKATKVSIAPGMEKHPILQGVNPQGFTSPSWLYKSAPLASTAQVLLTGQIPGQAPEPVFWTNRYRDSRIVSTSLGHWDDFKDKDFRQLIINAILWAMESK